MISQVKTFIFKILKENVLDVEMKNIDLMSCKFSDNVCKSCGKFKHLTTVCLSSSKLLQHNSTCQAELEVQEEQPYMKVTLFQSN